MYNINTEVVRLTVLIIDDEELIRNVIKEYCLSANYNVLEADDGLVAIDIVKKNNVDVIILDIMMPKKDGYSTLREIKEIKNIPVIMLSARAEEYDKLMGFDLGIDDYLTKPSSASKTL
jgi:DNA-binding response OmpR family regulator